MKDQQHRWLAGGYDLEIGHFQRWIAWWLAGGQWLFCPVIHDNYVVHNLASVLAKVPTIDRAIVLEYVGIRTIWVSGIICKTLNI